MTKQLISTSFLFATLLLTTNCSNSGSSGSNDAPKTDLNDGKSSVTFSGATSRTTQYGVEANTKTYCVRSKNGTSILLQENGENRKNDAWMYDGIYIEVRPSVRVQDVRELESSSDSRVYAAIKELGSDKRTTFRSGEQKCKFNATLEGKDLRATFDCQNFKNSDDTVPTLNFYGWVECTLRDM